MPDAEKHEGTAIHYRVKDAEAFRGKDLVILGGGDSALDWTLQFAETANSVVLVHRRSEFRAAPASVEKMFALREEGRCDFMEGTVQGIVEDGGALKGVKVTGKDGITRSVSAGSVADFLGLVAEAGTDCQLGDAAQSQDDSG